MISIMTRISRSVSSQPVQIAGVELPSVVRAVLSLLTLLAGIVFTALAVVAATIVLPFALVITALTDAEQEKGRRGWRPVPA